MSIQQEKFKEIADAIRAKTGTTELIKPIDFPSKIDSVYEAGKVAQHKDFMEKFLEYRNEYSQYFFAGSGWTRELFAPTKSMKPKSAVGMFYYHNTMRGYTLSYDLVERLSELGVTLDFSDCINFQYTFCYGYFKRIGVIDCSSASTLQNTFQNASIGIIEKLIVHKNLKFSNTFNTIAKLTHVIFEGVIGQNGLNLQWADLDYESLASIKNCLEDKSTDTSGTSWKITIGTDNKSKYTESDLAEIKAKGWTVQ